MVPPKPPVLPMIVKTWLRVDVDVADTCKVAPVRLMLALYWSLSDVPPPLLLRSTWKVVKARVEAAPATVSVPMPPTVPGFTVLAVSAAAQRDVAGARAVRIGVALVVQVVGAGSDGHGETVGEDVTGPWRGACRR